MEAASKTAAPSREASDHGFMVHTKHNCGKCYQSPIIGKRYTSSVLSDFDLCSSCFEAYSGPEIGLSEVVLSECLAIRFFLIFRLEEFSQSFLSCILRLYSP